GTYNFIGATDPHLELALANPAELTEEEREIIEEEFFWINPYPLDDDGDDPYFSKRYAALNEVRKTRSLTEEEIRDLTALFFLWGVSPRLHERYGIEHLRGQDHYSREDVIEIIRAQRKICADLIDMYRWADQNGSEIITSPYYHPILPLLTSDGWEEVTKTSWEEDAYLQLRMAVERYKEIFGHEPAGLWPPEQAVSQDVLEPIERAGFDWFVTDEGILEKTTGESASFTSKTEVYRVEGTTKNLNVIFRDSEISDRISFSYGNKPTEAALDDLMGELRAVKNKLENPGDHLLTLALDGENWMFMAEYPNNGRNFLEGFYDRLEGANWIKTVTPANFFKANPGKTNTLETLATGSWLGDLATWRGEPEEDAAWRRIIEARRIEDKSSSGKEKSKSILAAQGSDWFWWYVRDGPGLR
ncbi:hypothetical protein KGY64_07595, partial [Candidatus Bipolaricaulota bacterium]|nr:hypothetical protein [Candidatus Bipolaricaulota bacterium]